MASQESTRTLERGLRVIRLLIEQAITSQQQATTNAR